MAAVYRSRFKWFGEEFKALLEKHKKARLTEACIYLANEIKKTIGIKAGKQGAPESEMKRSEPGKPPHLEYGHLRRSITWEVNNGEIGRVGSNLPYAGYLERSTKHMAARPFLNPALAAHRNTIRRILTRPMK